MLKGAAPLCGDFGGAGISVTTDLWIHANVRDEGAESTRRMDTISITHAYSVGESAVYM